MSFGLVGNYDNGSWELHVSYAKAVSPWVDTLVFIGCSVFQCMEEPSFIQLLLMAGYVQIFTLT